jgi:CCR4-NOT transcription complex subunit 1
MRAQPGELLGFGSVVFAQIRWLINNVSRKNQKSTSAELANLLGLYGECAFTYTVRCLVEDIDFREARVGQFALKVQMLASHFGKLVTRPNFVSLIGDSIGRASLITPLTEEWLGSVIKAIRTTPAQQLALGLGIAQLADEAVAAEGDKFVQARLAELTQEVAVALPDHLLYALLFFISSREGLEAQHSALVKLLQNTFTEDKAPLTLVPLLYGKERETLDLNSRLSYTKVRDGPPPPPPLLTPEVDDVAELMRDLGYSCCASGKCVAELLAQFGDGQLDNPEASVAAAVGMMASTATSLDDSLSLHGAFSTAVSGKYLEFDAKFDEDGGADTQALTAWNIEAFVEGVREAVPSLSWPAVFGALDQATVAPDIGAAGFAILVAIHKRACGGQPLPASAVLGEWANAGAQFCLLTHAVEASADTVAWGEEAGPQVSPAPEGTIKPDLQPWLSLKLTEALLRLSAIGYYAQAHALLSKPLHAAPQLLLAALLTHGGAQAGTPGEALLQRELLEDLFPLFLGGDSPGSAALLQRLWPAQPYAIMRGMAQLHRVQPQSILRLLDLATSFNALEQVLQLRAFSFTIDLAACAQRKELIDLEPWLHESLARDTEHAFVHACISYLREKLLTGSSTNLARATSATNLNVLSVDAAATFFRILTAANLPPPLAAELSELYVQSVKAKPKLQGLFGGPASAPAANGKPAAVLGLVAGVPASVADAAAVPDSSPVLASEPPLVLGTGPSCTLSLPVGLGGSEPVALPGAPAAPPPSASMSGAPLPGMPGGEAMAFPPDIEEVANSYFQKIYSDAASIDDIIVVLRQFQAAPPQSREQKVYVCMVHNLFDEYRYFPKYPDKPLRTTAVLFGALVQHGLVTHITLGLFLRYVLEAVKKQALSKMNKFGLTALNQFLPRLAEWPQYCQLLHAVPHLSQVNPELPPFLEAAIAGSAGGASPALLPGGDTGASGLQQRGGFLPSALSGGGDPDGLAQMVSSALPGGADGMGGAFQQPGLPTGFGGAPADALSPAAPPAQAPGLPSHLQQVAGLGMQAPQLPPQPPQPPPFQATNNSVQNTAASPAAAELSNVSMASALGGVGGFGREGCIETLMSASAAAEVSPPPDSVQDRIGFVLNNMSAANVPVKAAELLAALLSYDGTVPWFANYLVVRRVALEPNFHSLYVSLLEALALPRLYRSILDSTLQNARVLLSSHKIRSSSSERSLLKNLGSWLGQITLGRNKPLLMRDLDLKELVCDAYENGRLIAVVPFVCKVLDAGSASRVFMPPNPWVMGLMSLLMELYQVLDHSAPILLIPRALAPVARAT